MPQAETRRATLRGLIADGLRKLHLWDEGARRPRYVLCWTAADGTLHVTGYARNAEGLAALRADVEGLTNA
jgi:hypothetical protein